MTGGLSPDRNANNADLTFPEEPASSPLKIMKPYDILDDVTREEISKTHECFSEPSSAFLPKADMAKSKSFFSGTSHSSKH